MVKRAELKALGEDTPFLDFIMELLIQLLPVLIGCFGAASALDRLQRADRLTRVRLKMEVNRKLRDNESIDLLAGPLVAAILEAAKDTTEAEMTALVAA